MSTLEVTYNPPSGQSVVTLAGTVANDAQFDTQPVVGDQIVYPDALTVDAQLNISGPNGAYTLYHVNGTGTTVNEAYSLSVSDTTAPVLTSPSATVTGDTTLDAQVTTDEGNGTLYVLASANATETVATVQGSGTTQAVSATGVQTVGLTGLTASTPYYVHFVHTDAAANDSTRVTAAQVTTDPAPETASTTVTAVVPAGETLTTLTGTITTDVRFATQPVAGDQIVAPDTISVDAQLNISAADGSYVVHHVRKSAGTWVYTDYVVSSTDTTAPVLSNANATPNGQSSISAVVTTNEAGGSLYAVATGNSTETATYIVNNGIALSVGSTGEQAFSLNGLDPGTAYYVHCVQKDGANNTSNVVSTAQVVTDSSMAGTATGSANWTVAAGYNSPVTLVAPVEPYVFEQWASAPVAGEQLITQAGDGSFDQNGNFSTDVETIIPVWFVGLDGTMHYLTLDTTGLAATGDPSDTTAPTITLTGANPLNLSAGSTYVEPGYSASDNVDGDLTANVTVTGSVNTNTPGSYALTYSVSDAAGNLTTTTRTVNVVDNDAPSLTLTGANPLTIIQGTAYAEPGYTATDAVEGDLTNDVVVTGTVDHLTVGNYTLTYTVQDSSGNQASQTRTVTVDPQAVDTIPDAFLFNSVTGQPLQTLVESNAITVTGVAADTDVPVTIAGDPSSQYKVSTDGGATWGGRTSSPTNVRLGYLIIVSHTTSPYGTTTVTSTLTVGGVDGSFVSTTETGDVVKPEITLVGGDVTLVEGTAYVEPGYAATDNRDGDLSGSVVVTGTVDETTPGLYVITYTVQDAAGNNANATRLVLVEEDVQPPTITLIGGANYYVPLDATWSEPGYTATDNRDGDLTANVVVAGTVDTAIEGYYSLTYTVADAKGNTRTATRVVRVGSGVTVGGSGPNLRSIAQPIASSV